MGNELRTSFLKHTPIGKKTQAQPYTAAAHLRYASRQSATDYVEAVRMPLHYWAAQDFLNKREDAIRSNGRICDKLTLVFPRGMAMDHAIVATRSYMENVSDGRAPFRFSLQNFTDQTENPHAHIIYIDADMRTGKRVFRTSDLNSTDRLKDAWESAANDVLEREGYTFRLDREAVKELKREKANENDAEPDAPTRQLPSEPDQAHAHAPVPDTSEDAVAENRVPELLRENGLLPEEHLPDLAELDNDAEEIAREAAEPQGRGRISAGLAPESVAKRVKGAHQLGLRLESAQRDRRAMEIAQQWRESADVSHAAAVGAEGARIQAKERMDHYQTVWGLAGWQILGWKTPARREAERRQSHLREAETAYKRAAEVAGCDARTAEELARTSRINQRIEGYADMSHEQRHQALAEMKLAEEQIADTRDEQLEPVTDMALYEAYKAGEITAEEALSACDARGFEACAEQIRYEVERQKEEGLEM